MGICAQNIKYEVSEEVDLKYLSKAQITEDDLRTLQRAFKELDTDKKGYIEYDINKIKSS